MLNQVSLKKSLTLNNIDLHLNLNPVADASLIIDDQLCTVNISQAEFKHSSAIKTKNEEEEKNRRKTYTDDPRDLHPTTQDMNSK